MSACEQFPNFSVLEHGKDVFKTVKNLILGNFEGFKLPEWFKENHHFIVNNLHDWDVIERYTTYHDCAKPRCLVIDEEGRRHYPDHAAKSKELWLELFPQDIVVADLIGYDMLFHTKKWEEISELDLDTKTLVTLMVTAFAEIHSNAKQFPEGLESTSFKIKYKKLEKASRKLVESLKKHIDAYSYVIVRNDLSEAQKAVQGGHAIYELAKQGYQHPSLVYVVVRDEKKLKKVMEMLMSNNVKFSIFREPIFHNEITALVTEPLVGEEREILKKYQLMS